ncbi:hypothetical protein ACO0SA_002030 [Hanseniaspora valbyensis]
MEINNEVTFKQDYKFFLDSSFYLRLKDFKLHQQKLSNDILILPSSRINYLNKSISLSDESFDTISNTADMPNIVLGSIKNFNTIEQFKNLNKIEYLKEVAVNKKYDKFFFHIISFADLKKFSLVYWICVPILKVDGLSFKFEQENNSVVDIKFDDLLPFDIVDDSTLICNFSFCKIDTNNGKLELSILLRNILIKKTLISEVKKFTLYIISKDKKEFQTFIITPHFEKETITFDDVNIKGWEKNIDNKLIPKFINFSSLLDPIKMNEQNVSLNLELMKWRINPDLDLEILKKQKILLLGAGTLGCYISRCLLAWGIYDITFVDDGVVSHSNPVRQPLFNFEDVGKNKAETASLNLKKIYPLCQSKFVKMKVPMIGHSDTIDEEVFLKLEKLIQESDVTFLLMDSREARWLPTLIGKCENKTVINTAIGYDNFLVMRHGDLSDENKNLGCYFCSDILAPVDSLKDRTLDQMCTVTRPGCAMMASAVAVEMLVNYLQTKNNSHDALAENQIRGFLNDFSNKKNIVNSYKYCSACSNSIIENYKLNKWEFVKLALKNSKYVEDISGLTAVHLETEQLLLDMEALGI